MRRGDRGGLPVDPACAGGSYHTKVALKGTAAEVTCMIYEIRVFCWIFTRSKGKS